MKTLSIAILATLLFAVFPACADSERYVTLTLPTLTAVATNANAGYPLVVWGATNTVDIAEGETGELICAEGGVLFKVTKNGTTITARPASVSNLAATPRGTTVAGPATFSLLNYFSEPQVVIPSPQALNPAALMTVKISPMTFDPRQTVTVAPGMGNVQIVLESSTNLLNWADATNGVYADDLRFFRVKLTKLNP